MAAALGAACFLNSLGHDFTYDDNAIVRDNPRIRSLGQVSRIWLSDWWAPPNAEEDVVRRYRDRLYRPLTVFSFALNYAIGGLAPAGYHAANVLLHAAACLLVWRLARRLLGAPDLATAGALLFAVHPIHAEAVANVVGRAEILAAMFLLLGLLVLLPADQPPRPRRTLAAAGLFLLALFSKETAVCYWPVALLALHFAAWRPQRDGHDRWVRTGVRAKPAAYSETTDVREWWLRTGALLLLPALVYLPLRYVALGYRLLREAPPGELTNPLVWADLPHRVLHAFTVLGHYTRLLIAPVKLSANYGLRVIDPDAGPGLMTLLGVLMAAGLVAALVGYWRRPLTWRRLALLSALFLASYVLISNTVLVIGVAVGERLMYWPSVPLLLALTVGVLALWQQAQQRGRLTPEAARLLRICGLLLLAALGLRSFVRSADWSSNLTLFLRDVETYPQSAELNQAAANELLWEVQRIFESGSREDPGPLLETADEYLQRALAIYPRYAAAMQLRGRVLGLLGRPAEAQAWLEQAVQLGPLDSTARELLAHLRASAAENAARAAALAEQVATRPADVALRCAYGEFLLQLGRDAEAQAQLEEAVRLEPRNPEALRLLGEACAARNQRDRAIELLRAAAEQAPNDWRIHVNLAALLATSDPEAALVHARKAQQLQPEAVDTNQQLAEALAVNGQLEAAIAIYRRITPALEPGHPKRRLFLERLHDLELRRR